MGIEFKIMLGAALFLGGFLWSYLFLRQFLYNFIVAFPMIKKMNALQDGLIAVGAKRYTVISSLVTFFIGAVIVFLVLHFLKLYQILCFFGGVVSAFALMISRVSLKNKEMFDLFCNAYYRFVPDDELRTILYNKEVKQIKPRLRKMGISGTFVPEFKK